MQKSSLLTLFLLCLASACGLENPGPVEGNASTMVNQLALEDCSAFGCPNGCIQIDYGVDDNASGMLDANEVDGTEYICHGSDGAPGAQGEPGAAGASGESGAQGEQGEQGIPGNRRTG